MFLIDGELLKNRSSPANHHDRHQQKTIFATTVESIVTYRPSACRPRRRVRQVRMQAEPEADGVAPRRQGCRHGPWAQDRLRRESKAEKQQQQETANKRDDTFGMIANSSSGTLPLFRISPVSIHFRSFTKLQTKRLCWTGLVCALNKMCVFTESRAKPSLIVGEKRICNSLSQAGARGSKTRVTFKREAYLLSIEPRVRWAEQSVSNS